MGWFGRLVGTDKAIDNLLDKNEGLLVRAGGWVDGLKYTDQEKAEDAQVTRKWGLAQLQALAPFKVVQRIIAFSVLFVWVLVCLNVMAAIWIKALYPEIDAVTMLWEFAISDFVFWPVLAVLSLYMTGGVLPGVFSNRGQQQ